MPAIVAISLSDSVPVARVYNPDRIDGGLATFLEKDTNAGVLVGNSPLTLSLARPSKTSRLTKVRAKIVVPILDAENNLSHSLTADVQFLLPEKSTLTERTDLLALFSDVISSSEMSALVVDNESLY